MMRRGDLIAAVPAAALTLAFWVIETLVPNLIPIPVRWGWIAVGAAATVAATMLVLRFLQRVVRLHPGPWIPHPFWRSRRWVRERPRVSILLASASANFGISTLDSLMVSLTVHRDASRSRRPCEILFDDAVLTLVQRHRGELRAWRLRPIESGGFLALPMASGQSDHALVVFALVALPLASAHAPDLNEPYSLALDRVAGKLLGARPILGRLPNARWAKTSSV